MMENLKMLLYGSQKLNAYQRALAIKEFEKLEAENKIRIKEVLNGFIEWFNKHDKTQSILKERVGEYLIKKG